MKKELEEKLYTKYSGMFADHTKPMSQTCMCWGCSCGDGWYHIIDHMCEELAQLQEQYDIQIIFDQIKEKFGTLRVYSHSTLGPRWTQIDDVFFLDGDSEIERVHAGWHKGTKVPSYSGVQDRVTEVISKAEDFSSITCEFCGMTGAVSRNSGWIHTLCDSCEAIREKERKDREKELDDSNHTCGEQAGSA
jgi:hypothetical protein